jgi:hypothetical protein
MHGRTPVVNVLLEAGAKDGRAAPAIEPRPQPARSIGEALGRSIPLLQRADEAFMAKAGCPSCHHDTLTAMTVATARERGLLVDETRARKQTAVMAGYLDSWRERVLQDRTFGGAVSSTSQVLLAVAAGERPGDRTTDAMARYVKAHQLPDGHWATLANRPPSGASAIQVTALAMRALQLYAPPALKIEYDRAVARAAAWLERAVATSTDQRAYQLLGLQWAGLQRGAAARAVAATLLSQQRSDGGWAQIPSLDSDAFATGQALFALAQSNTLPTGSSAYQRGVRFLLATQLADGSWYVKSRSIPLQPFFETGFPHGKDQWISAAATNWAASALCLAAPVVVGGR